MWSSIGKFHLIFTRCSLYFWVYRPTLAHSTASFKGHLKLFLFRAASYSYRRLINDSGKRSSCYCRVVYNVIVTAGRGAGGGVVQVPPRAIEYQPN